MKSTTKNIIERGGIKWAEIMGSTFIFAAVYLILYVLYNFTSALAAKHFGLEPILFFDKIRYMTPSEAWYPHAVRRTFISGALLMSLIGVFSYLFYLASSKTYIFIRLFLIWTSLISFGILGQRLISIPFNSRYELGIFCAYMYYETTTNYALAFMGFVLLVLVGFLYAKPFLQTASSSAQVANDGNRLQFFLFQVVVPLLAGSVISILIPFPENIVPNAVASLCCAIILTVVFIIVMTMGPVKIPKQTQWEKWPIVPLILIILTIVLYRVVLTIGMEIPDPNPLFFGQ